MGRRGPKPLGAAHHIARGNYRPSRHGPRPQPAMAESDDPWKTILRLPDGPPPAPRALDPIEELLKREKIEVTDEDRKPRG
jgi:hypothetical protein